MKRNQLVGFSPDSKGEKDGQGQEPFGNQSHNLMLVHRQDPRLASEDRQGAPRTNVLCLGL